jgi:2-polyprenyl-3-methyl-5-hydroxy-6-metoxy-1,4-benzoquinol methylase
MLIYNFHAHVMKIFLGVAGTEDLRPCAEISMQSHWENIYSTKDLTKVSWFENEPTLSIQLTKDEVAKSKSLQSRPKESIRILDVGSGDSLLSCKLFADGYTSVTAADISAAAIERSRLRCVTLNPDANVSHVVADVTHHQFREAVYDVWHDRAVFHFMTSATDQSAYIDNCARAVSENGVIIIGTFSKNGPKQCSNITVEQLDEESLRRCFSDEKGFTFKRSFTTIHHTPGGSNQEFIFAIFHRRARN